MTEQSQTGAAGSDPGTGTQGASGSTGATGATGADAPAWKTAMEIPQHMLKETAEETLGEVFKAFDGFQKKASQAGPVGKSPDEYKFDFDDKLKPFFAQADDPALKNFQTVAHKYGLPIKTANAIIAETFGPLAAEGKLPQPFNPRAELEAIGKLLGKSGAEMAPAIEQASAELEAWSKNIGTQLKLNENEQIELESLMLTANGFGLLRKLQAAQGGDSFKLGGQGSSGPLSRADLEAMQSDPRFDPQSPKYDKGFRQRYEEGWKNLPPDQLRR